MKHTVCIYRFGVDVLSGACVYIHIQDGGPTDAKLTIMFTDTTHFNGFCSVPRIEKSSHFKRVARYGSPVFTLWSWALFFFKSEPE